MFKYSAKIKYFGNPYISKRVHCSENEISIELLKLLFDVEDICVQWYEIYETEERDNETEITNKIDFGY